MKRSFSMLINPWFTWQCHRSMHLLHIERMVSDLEQHQLRVFRCRPDGMPIAFGAPSPSSSSSSSPPPAAPSCAESCCVFPTLGCGEVPKGEVAKGKTDHVPKPSLAPPPPPGGQHARCCHPVSDSCCICPPKSRG